MPAKQVRTKRSRRRGATLIFVACLSMGAVTMVAVVVDIGYLAMTKTQLHAAADSAALAGGMELYKGLGAGRIMTPSEATALAQQQAVTFAANNCAGDRSSVYCDGGRDVRFGNAIYDTGSGTWTQSWGTEPYNMIGVSLLRNQADSANGDTPMPLFFAGLVGASANLAVTSAAALMPSNTIQIPPGGTSTLMPLTVDLPSWAQLIDDDTGPDSYNYNPSSGQVTNGADGLKEINLYPNEDPSQPSGNRGLLDLGAGNSASDIGAQIRNGVTASQLANAGFPNGISASSETPTVVGGAPGLKSSLNDDLTSIIGQARTVAVFESASGSGSGTNYSVVKFVGLRILAVKLTGNDKYVWAQPATVVDSTYVPDLDGEVNEDSVFSPIILIQ